MNGGDSQRGLLFSSRGICLSGSPGGDGDWRVSAMGWKPRASEQRTGTIEQMRTYVPVGKGVYLVDQNWR